VSTASDPETAFAQGRMRPDRSRVTTPDAGPTAARLRTAGLGNRLVRPFDIAIAAGECIAVTGASGSGKSLLLRLIADLDEGDGEVFLDGVARSTVQAPAWRRQVAYAAAESGWWNEAVAPHFPDLAAARVMAPAFDLRPELFDGTVLRLSTGEKQRLALLRSLLGNPKVLLLDEPTGALDAGSRTLVEAALRDHLARGCAMVLVTHDLRQAARLGHQHFVMRAGTLNRA
jgi:ABC-type iron transport system FetAB ATPase subunit